MCFGEVLPQRLRGHKARKSKCPDLQDVGNRHVSPKLQDNCLQETLLAWHSENWHSFYMSDFASLPTFHVEVSAMTIEGDVLFHISNVCTAVHNKLPVNFFVEIN
jgi:hypothetical protein